MSFQYTTIITKKNGQLNGKKKHTHISWSEEETHCRLTVSIQKCWLYSCYSFNGKVLKCGWRLNNLSLDLFCLDSKRNKIANFLFEYLWLCAQCISNGLMSCGFLQRWSNVMTTFPSIVTTESIQCNENNAIVFGVSHIITKKSIKLREFLIVSLFATEIQIWISQYKCHMRSTRPLNHSYKNFSSETIERK